MGKELIREEGMYGRGEREGGETRTKRAKKWRNTKPRKKERREGERETEGERERERKKRAEMSEAKRKGSLGIPIDKRETERIKRENDGVDAERNGEPEAD